MDANDRNFLDFYAVKDSRNHRTRPDRLVSMPRRPTMKRIRFMLSLYLALSLLCSLAAAQQALQTPAAIVPRLVSFSGRATNPQGAALSGVIGATFSIYKDQYDGAPIWLETQNVEADANGNYTAQLGATKPAGLPMELFTSGEARWLGVVINGGSEQPRALLLSVPYALKAADAQTLAGLPASAFMLAGTVAAAGNAASAAMSSAETVVPAVSGTGTTDFIPLWTNTTGALGNSVLFQSGSGATAKTGINTTTPGTTLDVNGAATVRGTLNLPATGTATATAGKNSQPQDFIASVFNKTSATAVAQKFQWQAEPLNNDTSTPSGAMSLLYGAGTAAPAETGLKINNKGQLTFATGQAFPIPSSSVTNTDLQHSSLTVKAGTDLTGGGSVALGGTTTLNLDTTKVPQLAAVNTFTNQNTIDVTTICNQSFNCFPGLAVNNSGGTASTTGGDGIDITTGEFSLGLRITAGSEAIYATSGFSGGIFEGNGGGGIYGDEQIDDDFLAGVNGYQIAAPASHATIGVWGSSSSSRGFGVYGNQVLQNQSGFQRPAGVWGDSSASAGVVGTSDIDDGVVGLTADTDTGQRAGFFDNISSSANEVVLLAEDFTLGGFCEITTGGDLGCTGSKSAVVPIEGGSRKVALYAVESAENWFEDAGSGQLSNGTAVVDLESTFGGTVNTNLDYHVFLTPNGDCKGLYVAEKSPTSFVVHELGGGTSNIAFDYRIMAKRKGYETIRLADKTAVFRLSETPSGVRKAEAHPAKMPPSPQEVRERLLKKMGVRPVAQLSKPAPASVTKK
jgi:hypothetical protein